MKKEKVPIINECPRYDKFWNETREKKWLSGLPVETLRKYLDSMELRVDWNEMDSGKIREYCKELLGEKVL